MSPSEQTCGAQASRGVRSRTSRGTSRGARVSLLLILVVVMTAGWSKPAEAQQIPTALDRSEIAVDTSVAEPPSVPSVGITIESEEGGLSKTVTIVLLMTVGAILPLLLVMMTSFTRFIVVFGLTKNAIGLQTVPPTPVLIGLALVLTMFVMNPVLKQVNEDAIQPLLDGQIKAEEAMDLGYAPMRDFMLAQTDEADLRLFVDLSHAEQPESPANVPAATLIPAFVISELRTAFIIGFIIFLPFLVVDLIVSTVLMSLGMVMLPPVFISLPLKLLLFVLVDGWVIIVGSVVASVHGVVG